MELETISVKCDTNHLLTAWVKNRNGGFYALHIENKTVEIFKNTENGQSCLVGSYLTYHQKQ